MDNNHGQIVNLIWKIADDVLRDVFVRGKYRDVILPLVVLRRLDAVLEASKDQVMQIHAEQAKDQIFDVQEYYDATGYSYFNTSKWTLKKLAETVTDNTDLLVDNFIEYIEGYSDNVKEVIKCFDYYNVAKKLAKNDRLLPAINSITDPNINLTNKDVVDSDGNVIPAIDNISMGMVFEELLRRFNEENNEEAGEHFTPRDVVSLLCKLVFEPYGDDLPPIISIYDPACGSGGMLTESYEYLVTNGIDANRIRLSGTEINPETYAICKSDLILKGINPQGIFNGNTITDNHFEGSDFGFMITNPPYGKSWSTDQASIYDDNGLKDKRYELTLPNFLGENELLDCTPRTSDGQLLFILEEISKMKSLKIQPQGTRIASIHNGSSLFTGDAGSGESNTRRYLVENDLIDAIIQLPNNIFYNTGIATYAWILTNKKADHRKGKVQLIDASQAFEKLRKNQGARNCTITPDQQAHILKIYHDFKDNSHDQNQEFPIISKIFDNDELRYFNVIIERPLRYCSQFDQRTIDNMLFDPKELDLSKWLYETYGDQVFTDLPAQRPQIEEYLKQNEIKLNSKKLDALLSAKAWTARKSLVDAATKLMEAMGTEVYMDFNAFSAKLTKSAKELGLPLKSTEISALAKAMSHTDDKGCPVIKKIHKANSKDIAKLMERYGITKDKLPDYGFFPYGNNEYVQYETDADLRDNEKITVTQDIHSYFTKEVKQFVNDAWIDIASTKIGCEISFNKYFYRPAPMRTLEENQAEFESLDAQVKSLLNSLFS